MSAFPVDVSRQSLRGDAITGHAAKRLIPCAKTRTDFLILRNASRLDWRRAGTAAGEARQRLHQAGKVRLGVAARLDELHAGTCGYCKSGLIRCKAKAYLTMNRSEKSQLMRSIISDRSTATRCNHQTLE